MNQKQKMEKTPPVVAVLGHVDHGKTTLLDKIRSTSEAQKEAGGITQKVGATMVGFKGEKITFIDTPGHAAFSAMRSQGLNASDLAILIVAADDGVKPQTREALEIVRRAGIPFIVVLTKVDLATADVESSLKQLETEGVSFEGRGGNVPFVQISAKTGEGVDKLLELIQLYSDLNADVKKYPDGLNGVVIETKQSKGGPLISVIVKSGKISKGDRVFINNEPCQIKNIVGSDGKILDKVLPGEPALILGCTKLPPVGSRISENIFGEGIIGRDSEKRMPKEKELGVVIKAGSRGSLEAILSNLPPGVVSITSGIGDVIEADVFNAKNLSDKKSISMILAFEVKVSSSVKKLADTEGVLIYEFDIIYKLFEKLEEILKEGREKILGKALILTTFPFNGEKIAGCRMLEGEITKDTMLKLTRDERLVGIVKAVSLKKGRSTVEKVSSGEEFGVFIKPQLDFKEKDMLLSVEIKKK